MSTPRLRFAPSPTGYFHVGNLRTAIFAWLTARQSGGKFCLRIEDTDRERLVLDSIRAILESLSWIGMDLDEGPSLEELKKAGYSCEGVKDMGGDHGPYIQSLRLPRYKEVAELLVEKGYAYRCDCTPERLEEERAAQMARKVPPGYSGYCRDRDVPKDKPHVIRFKIPHGEKIILNDLVRGEIVWENPALRDTVILKSDGFPTYHLASVCDDHDMGITHVFRGEEWIPTTPIHIKEYEALGWEMPQIGHMPQVLGDSGKKLSKREGAVSVDSFREGGYLPEALFNFLALIGWSPGEGEEQEVFTQKELIERFSVKKINKAGGVFSYDKLGWMNGMHIRRLSIEELAKRVKPFLENAGLKVDDKILLEITPHIQERMTVLTEALGLVSFLFVDKIEHELKSMFAKGIDAPKAIEILQMGKQLLNELPTFDVASVEATIRGMVGKFTYPMGAIFMVMRIGVTGKKVTPPLFESIAILGKEKSLHRIDQAIEKLANA
ncbi:MAG: glutamate--tRNA ligase [Deltaproteobacteria bacterium]|nr:glutamate--tRNA ligase [Deltaproteobacteria bacterium]